MQKIRYEKKGRISYVMLDISDMNPISFEVVSELHNVWEDFREDDESWVAILGSRRKNFAAGFDIKDIKKIFEQGSFSWNKSSMFGDKRLGPDGHGVTKPIIGAINGIANGAGLWLTLQTDIRIATPQTRFGLGEAMLNFPVEFAGLLTRYMPRAIINELLFTGRNIDAQRFFDLGIINQIADPEDLMKEAIKTAEGICKRGPMSVRVMKELVNHGYEMEYDRLMALTAAKVVPVVNSEDTREAIDCFLEKRIPAWKLK